MKFELLDRNMQWTLFASCVLFIFTSCATTDKFSSWDISPSLEREINALCLEQSEENHFPGLAVAVASKHSKIWSNSYGYANIEAEEAIDTEEHLFRIGSISKTVTAAALARLYEDGKLALDLPIGQYYSKIPSDKAALTLRLLGGHLGGIRHYKGFEFLSKLHYENVFDPLEVFIEDTLLCVPGMAFNYSTYGWTLMSAVMESGAGDSFLNIIKKEVSIPLQISDLKADQIDSTHYKRVTFYHLEEEQHQIAPVVDLSNKWAGGGYLCSAEDLSRFGYALVRPGYLKRNVLEVFTQSQKTTSGEVTNYGIGFSTGTDDQGRKWIGHSGGSIGGTSMLLIYPEHDLVVVTLVNMGGAKMNNLAQRIADLFFDTSD